jgi:hypothetical protein
MAGGMEQRVGPTTFLMYDTGKLAVVIVPRGARSPREPLDTTKGRVLKGITVALVLESKPQRR